jgi:hypothetical protein
MDDDTCSASIDRMFSFWVVSRPSLISVKGNNPILQSTAVAMWGTAGSAFDCRLFSCVQTYNSSIVNNVLHEKLLDSIPVQLEIFPAGAPQLQHVLDRALQNGTWIDCKASDIEGPDLGSVTRMISNSTCTENNMWCYNGKSVKTEWYPKTCI